jgi:hypothetical protein
MPRLRFTVRRMLIAVAIVAILCGGGVQIRRAIAFSQLASSHTSFGLFWHSQEQWHRQFARSILESDRPRLSENDAAEQTEQAEKSKVLADYHAAMKAKYEAAARRPWLSVEPDPPRPEL